MTDPVTIEVRVSTRKRNCTFFSDRIEVTKGDKLLCTLYYVDIGVILYGPKISFFKTIVYNIFYTGVFGTNAFVICPKNWKEAWISTRGMPKEEFEKIRKIVGESVPIKVAQGKKMVQLHKDSDF